MNANLKLFPVSTGYDASGGLTIAGHSLCELADQYGTPLYLYDAATVENQVQRLTAALRQHYPGHYEITYAAKAYFSLGFARKLAGMGLGVDVVSLGELNVAQMAGFRPDSVHLHGNNKSIAELSAAVQWGVQAIVVDSLEELETLERIAERCQQTARIWLRISPGVAIHSHAYLQTAHSASKFGLPLEGGQAAEAIRRAMSSQWLHLTGLHTHLGSQFFEADPYCLGIASLMALAEETGFIPEEISPGGGWGVPYVVEQADDDPQPWIATVAGAVKEECGKRGWPLPKLVVEPGRWLVARSGVAVYTVGTTKTSGDGTHYVSVDGGMADNPRPALYQATYTAVLAERPDAAPVHKVTIVGKFCESGDQLISGIDFPAAQRGDRLVMPVAGAYQLSMASNYNLAPRPAALWLTREGVEVLQQREDIAGDHWFTYAP